jgi:hypothetical protein
MAIGPGSAVRPRWLRAAASLAVAVVALSACGDDEEPELTFEEQLVELEGRSLTPAEVAERVDVGETVCQMDDRILDELWQQLSDDQLEFQDLIIAELCPERAILYAGHTGRFVTDEAEESGVRTSTTRPTSTTATTTSPSTTRPTSTSIGATGTSGDQTDPSGSSTSISGTTPTSAADPSSTTTTTATTVTTSITRPTTTAPSSTAST